jgi:hypothetical protein
VAEGLLYTRGAQPGARRSLEFFGRRFLFAQPAVTHAGFSTARPNGRRVSGERRATAGSKTRVRCTRMLGGLAIHAPSLGCGVNNSSAARAQSQDRQNEVSNGFEILHSNHRQGCAVKNKQAPGHGLKPPS